MGITVGCSFSTRELRELQTGQALIAKALVELLGKKDDPAEDLAREWLRKDLADHFKLTA